ncbi:Zn-dependent exopeptidase [Earliella scabrosa]|nr:Zn-dependent exopeptidase [Earliella scabrosa]
MKFLTSGCLLAAAALSVVRAAPISNEEIADMTSKGFRLLDLEAGVDPVWKTEDEILDLLRADIGFFDVTETYDPEFTAKPQSFARLVELPPPSHADEINSILSTLSTSNMESYLNNLTAFNNRYYDSATGKAASQWIFDTLTSFIGDRSDVTVSKFTHSWQQFSVIARFEGTTSGPVTIIGAHEDSINLSSPSSGRAPGADDDGSGTVNLMEIFRALLSADFKPTTPLEIQFYSGEERGLLGSQAIARNYNTNGVEVKAMLQLDMTAYVKPGTEEVIALITDNADAGVTTFIRQLIDEYSELDWVDDRCGYGCSDHASWYREGFPGGMIFEGSFTAGNMNPRIHSASDTITVPGFSWSHSLEFAKVALAFAYELSA